MEAVSKNRLSSSEVLNRIMKPSYPMCMIKTDARLMDEASLVVTK